MFGAYTYGSVSYGGLIPTSVDVVVVRDILGQSRITQIIEKYQTGLTRVTRVNDTTETGIARISKIVDAIQQGQARLNQILIQNQSGHYMIDPSVIRHQTGIAKIMRFRVYPYTKVPSSTVYGPGNGVYGKKVNPYVDYE